MTLNKLIDNLCIDDAINILKFYYDYQQNPDYEIEKKEHADEDSLEVSLANKKYFFYSKKVTPIVDALTRKHKDTKFENIKEKAVHGIEKKLHVIIIDKKEIIEKLKERVEGCIRMGQPYI